MRIYKLELVFKTNLTKINKFWLIENINRIQWY